MIRSGGLEYIAAVRDWPKFIKHDVPPFLGLVGNRNASHVEYYQHKHSTVRVDAPFPLSELKSTVESFAARFKGFHKRGANPPEVTLGFTIVTNRTIAATFKTAVRAIGAGGVADRRTRTTLEKYTGLKDGALQKLCGALTLADRESDVDGQRLALRRELSELQANFPDNDQIAGLVELVRDRVLPNSNGTILREDVLRLFDVSAPQQLFPAPAVLEDIGTKVRREQHDTLLAAIVSARAPVIIEAGGGVGKTIVAQQLAASLPEGSVSVIYDCFGGGNYRNRSASRHASHVALQQIVNEISTHGLCLPMLPRQAPESRILQHFLHSLQTAACKLPANLPSALLVVLVDAADNAAMAANEFSESCFAIDLLKESLPDRCRLVMLCRPERTALLQPPSSVRKISLDSFSPTETLVHLRDYYPNATPAEGDEFHRLTTGNPRVQGNALRGAGSYEAMMVRLGLVGVTVNSQIEQQLQDALNRLRDHLAPIHQAHVEAICVGLANLQPRIPLEILAAAAGVTTDAIRSFVSDLGWPLWLRESAVQFRDEPTETWFTQHFATNNQQQIERYVDRLRPLAAQKEPQGAGQGA